MRLDEAKKLLKDSGYLVEKAPERTVARYQTFKKSAEKILKDLILDCLESYSSSILAFSPEELEDFLTDLDDQFKSGKFKEICLTMFDNDDFKVMLNDCVGEMYKALNDYDEGQDKLNNDGE